jgi:predicted Ser/Thr protein kinase
MTGWGVSSSKIRFNGKMYGVGRVINSGLTSLVYKTTAGRVVKQYKRDAPLSQLEREVFWLDRLSATGTVPELLAVDRSARAILMSDCGDPVSALNAPRDWEKQVTVLLAQLRANRCAHNDLSEHALLVKDGKLRVVDFACAVETTNDVISSIIKYGKKIRYFLDEQIVSYIRFRLYGAPQGSEPHCFVLWKSEEYERIKDELSTRFEILRTILYTPQFFSKLGEDANSVLKKFYSRRDAVHGDKGRTPFILFLVLDKEPRYGIRLNVSRGTREMVNVNVFDMKAKLRGGRTAFLHGSSSVQECYDNLEALSIYVQDVPKSYWLHWRPSFASVTDFFEQLNTIAGLDYVVLRNFDDLVDGRADQGSDIDILANDFYLFKRSTGAIGYKHKMPTDSLFKRARTLTGPTRDYYRPGPAHEYGGYKVAGLVNIAGQEITVDIRFVGDGYYCEEWERKILAGRVKLGNIWVPDTENLFYSLLYHALVHKPRLSNRYRRMLGEMAPTVGMDGQIAESDGQLWACLDQFMLVNRYTYDRPSELAISLSAAARKRMGITTEKDLQNARAFATRGQLLEAIDLAQGILWNESENVQAKRLVQAVERALSGLRAYATLVRLARVTRLGNSLPNSMKHSIKNLVLRGARAKS